jgi:hypothetical protein
MSTDNPVDVHALLEELPNHIISQRHPSTGGWLVGLLFESEEAGIATMQAIVTLLRDVARTTPRRPR